MTDAIPFTHRGSTTCSQPTSPDPLSHQEHPTQRPLDPPAPLRHPRLPPRRDDDDRPATHALRLDPSITKLQSLVLPRRLLRRVLKSEQRSELPSGMQRRAGQLTHPPPQASESLTASPPPPPPLPISPILRNMLPNPGPSHSKKSCCLDWANASSPSSRVGSVTASVSRFRSLNERPGWMMACCRGE